MFAKLRCELDEDIGGFKLADKPATDTHRPDVDLEGLERHVVQPKLAPKLSEALGRTAAANLLQSSVDGTDITITLRSHASSWL